MGFKLSNVPKVKCPNCQYEGDAKYGRSHGIEFLLLLTTWPLLLIPLFLYEGFTPTWRCPRCEFKNVIKQG